MIRNAFLREINVTFGVLTYLNMSTLNSIKAPISNDIKEFESFFHSLLKSKAPLLNIITSYIIKSKGKQMRPIFVFLSAKMFSDLNKSTYNAASLIELMHTATLVHDDVVDNSYQRRGFFSINALWKNKIAVLVGDYILSRGLLLAVENGEFELLRVVSEAVKEMSEGELLQIEKARKLDITEEVYFDVIKKKTASLLAACGEAGAVSVNAGKENSDKMKKVGEYIGIAFQIRDDIFDYQLNGNTGKPSGNDIKEKKMTLPLIHVLNNCSSGDKRRIIRIVKNKNNNMDKVKEVIDFVISNGGIEYAEKRMKEYKDKALEILLSLEDNDARKALIDFIDYTTTRKK